MSSKIVLLDYGHLGYDVNSPSPEKISKISINLPMLMELDLFVLGYYTLLILVQSGLK